MKTFNFLLVLLTFYFLLLPFASAQEATPSATPTINAKAQQFKEAFQEAVQGKIAEASRRAFIGTLKNIADTTLILETKDGIKQAAISTEAAILRDSGESKQTIKFADLAIGDFTIVMGYLGEKEVLEANRVIVNSNVQPKTNRKAIYGQVQEIDLKKETMIVKSLKDDQSWTLEIASSKGRSASGRKITGKEEFTEIEPGDRLIAAGTIANEANPYTLITPRLHVL